MAKNVSIHLLVQIGIAVLVGAIAGFIALILFGAIGGVAMGVAPEPTFTLVKDFICPDGTINYYDVQRSYHRPGESEPHVECIGADGQSEDVLPEAIFTVLGLTFAGVFLIIFVPGYIIFGIIGFFITRNVRKSKQEKE